MSNSHLFPQFRASSVIQLANQTFEELFIQIDREVNSIERGWRNWIDPEFLASYDCRGYYDNLFSYKPL